MAVLPVQNKAAATAATTTHAVTLTAAPTAGDLLVACFTASTPLANITAPAGWTAAFTDNDDGGTFAIGIWYRVVQLGDTATVSFTTAANQTGNLEVSEWSGVNTTTPLDIATGNDDASGIAATTGSTGPLAQPNELAIAFVAMGSTIGAPAEATGFTLLDTATLTRAIVGYKLTGTTSPLNAGFSWTTIRNPTAAIATFRDAVTPGPTFILEAALGQTPLATPTYTALTDRIRSVTTDRGRQHELRRFEPGSATIVGVNNDRALDPTNPSSPYYPNLKVKTRVRLRMVWLGVTYYLFTGFAKRIVPIWKNGVTSDTRFELVDLFGFLTGTLPNSPWELTIRTAASKRSWWRLGEKSGATVAIDQVSNFNGAYSGAPTFGVSSLPVFEPDTAVTFTGTNHVEVNDTNAGLVGDFTVEGWFVHGAATQIEYLVSQAIAYTLGGIIGGPSSYRFLAVYLDAAGKLNFAVDNSRTAGDIRQPSAATCTSASRYDDGNHHHFMATKSGTSIKLYVDGAQVGSTGTLTYSDGLGAGPVYIARFVDLVANRFNGTIDEVVTYDTALTVTEALSHYQAGATGWSGDTTGARINRILDYLGIAAGDRSIDTGNSTLQGESNLGTNAFSYLADLAQVENGRLFIDGQGRIVFQQRQHNMVAPYNQSQATFSNLNTAALPYKAGSVEAPLEDTDLYNDIPVSRANGTSYRAEDPASQASYGARTLPGMTALPLANDNDVVDAANWLLQRYSQPSPRVGSVVLAPNGLPTALWPQALGREIGDRITLNHQPPGGGSPFTTQQVIERVAQHFDASSFATWATTWALSPADATLYFVFDDTTAGQFDTGGVLAY